MLYLKVPQPASGFAVVGVAAVVTLDASGKCAAVRVGVTGAAAKAFRAKDTEAALTGKAPDEKTLTQAAAQSTNGVDANGDIFASAEYRTHLVAGLYQTRIGKSGRASEGMTLSQHGHAHYVTQRTSSVLHAVCS